MQNLLTESNPQKPLCELDLLKLLSRMTTICFDGTNMPCKLKIFTDKGVHTITAGKEKIDFERG